MSDHHGESGSALDVRTHELKTHPEAFEQVWNGWKTADLRQDDREFRLGDMLCLREWDPKTKRYGRSIMVRITCVTRGWGLPKGMCMLSLGPRSGYEKGERIFESERGGWLPGEWPDLREPRGDDIAPDPLADETTDEPLFTYVYRGEGDPRDTEELRGKIRGERIFFGKYPPSGPMKEWPLLAAMLVIMDWLDAELAEERAKLDLETARAFLSEATNGRPDFEGFAAHLDGEAEWQIDFHASGDAAGRSQAKSDADTLTRLAEHVRSAGKSGGYL